MDWTTFNSNKSTILFNQSKQTSPLCYILKVVFKIQLIYHHFWTLTGINFSEKREASQSIEFTAEDKARDLLNKNVNKS